MGTTQSCGNDDEQHRTSHDTCITFGVSNSNITIVLSILLIPIIPRHHQHHHNHHHRRSSATAAAAPPPTTTTTPPTSPTTKDPVNLKSNFGTSHYDGTLGHHLAGQDGAGIHSCIRKQCQGPIQTEAMRRRLSYLCLGVRRVNIHRLVSCQSNSSSLFRAALRGMASRVGSRIPQGKESRKAFRSSL